VRHGAASRARSEPNTPPGATRMATELRIQLMDGLVSVPRTGAVVRSGRLTPPWTLLDAQGEEVDPVARYLQELSLNDVSVLTIRSYAYDLLRWFRVLWALDVDWARATRAEADVLIGALRNGTNPQRRRATGGGSVPGSVNLKTGKRVLPLGYAATGINHTQTVVRCFYDFHAEHHRGPAANPMPRNQRRDEVLRHRSPIAGPPRPYRRGSLRQKESPQTPRAMSDERWDEFFGAMTCDRDRAVLLMFVTSAARAQELLGVTLGDIDWPGLRFYVISKGTRARQPVPASAEAFRALARYLDTLGPLRPIDPVWQTRRGVARPLTYSAMRRAFQRANAKLGTNWTPHDLRHTASMRMVNSPNLVPAEAQVVLRHAQLATTSIYVRADLEQLFDKVQESYQRPKPPVRPGIGFDENDMKAVFGG
jgi:integrase